MSCPQGLPEPLLLQRRWQLLAPGALMLLGLDGATWRFSFTASLLHLPAQGAQLRGVRLDDAGGFLMPVLTGCWRCRAPALHWCPGPAVTLFWSLQGSEGLRPRGAVKAVQPSPFPGGDGPGMSHRAGVNQVPCSGARGGQSCPWLPSFPLAAIPFALLGSLSHLLHCHPPGSPACWSSCCSCSCFPSL